MPRLVRPLQSRSLFLPAVLASAASLGVLAFQPASAQASAPVVRAAVPPPAAVAGGPAMAASVALTAPRTATQLPSQTKGALPISSLSAAPAPTVAASAAARQALPANAAKASPGATAVPATARWVALDIGHQPGGGSRSASGVAEHNFNLRFAAELEARLKQQGFAVRRLPTGLSLAERAQRAHGAALVVSVHHDGPTVVAPRTGALSAAGSGTRQSSALSAGSGFQLRVGQSEPLACARAVATQLQIAGRHFNTSGNGGWADKTLGIRAGGEGALLQQADVPVLHVSFADIANPAEERLANEDAWRSRQAAAVAKGLSLCLQRPASNGGVLPPAASASGARRA